MTTTPLLRLLPRLLAAVVLVVSGAYLLVYLYRWEWNRAVISGLFMLAAEVALVGSSIRADIRQLAARTEELEARTGPAPGPGSGLPVGARPTVRPARPFAWLREPVGGSFGVFVPVLLGAGVVLSAVAYLVERLAGAVAHGAVELRSPRRLDPLAPPEQGLLRPRAGSSGDTADGSRRRRTSALAGRVLLVAMTVVALIASIDLLADATQSRPSAPASGATTVVDLRIDQRRPRPVVEAAEALAVACRSTLYTGTDIVGITEVADDRVQIEIAPALTDLRRRRLFGCLEDATLDLLQGDVVGWHTPS